MSRTYTIIDCKTSLDLSAGVYAKVHAEQTAILPAASLHGTAVCGRVSVYYENNYNANASKVRIYLLNPDYDWKEVDSYGVEQMSLLRAARAKVALNANDAFTEAKANPSSQKLLLPQAVFDLNERFATERLVFATLDVELRSKIAQLEADPNVVQRHFEADFAAAWKFVVRLIGP